MEIAIGAARWVVGRALGPVTDGVLEAWAASKTLGPNIRELKLELLYAQGMLDSANVRDGRSPALRQLLLELRHLAYAADDVLDELDYFRIQDELDGTYETVGDYEERGLVRGLLLHARHTTRAIAGKVMCSCAGAGAGSRDDDPAAEQEIDAAKGRCLSSPAAAHAVGKFLPCCSLPSVHHSAAAGVPPAANDRRFLCGAWSSKTRHRENDVHTPKLKFDRVKMSTRMTDIVEQLKPVCAKVATILGLEPSGPNHAKTQATDLERRPKTTPGIIEPELYGRQIQKKFVANEIINGTYSHKDLTVLPIVGPGGIGKTAFTQYIYDQVKNHFQISIWICVSQNFNANKLVQEIVKQMPDGPNEKDNDTDQEKIEKGIQSKKFLLVLDDMWTYHEDEWKKLLAPFKKAGTKGNIVIVTTRIPKVAKMVESRDCSIKLESLPHKDSMDLFEACVFGDKKPWKDGPTGLQEVGEMIVERLKGFPLAIKTVGRLLRNQVTLDRWRTVLESREWELEANNDDDIMPALKLSYNYLPFHLQQCFSYCALFPEDYRFRREELTNLWIGLGLLGSDDKNKIIEDIAVGYLNELVDNGFFEQDGKECDSPYVMHDLLHELATNVSSYEVLRINSSDVRSIHIPTSIRHLSVIVENTSVKDRMTFENHKNDLSTLGKKLKAGNLRTIMLFGEHHGSFYKIFGDMLREAKSLRVIYLSGASYKIKDLLHNFLRLVHLRYLRIKDSSMLEARLPHNISRFYHLLVLDVQNHNDQLGFLRNMGNLLKLRHFLVPDDSIYSSIFAVGKLKFLKELKSFEVKREKEGFELKQIGQLVELQGSLGIHNLERVEDTREADEAKLAHMNRLDRLKLDWNSNRCNKDPILEANVLENLKPHSSLRKLSIAGHGGATCPNWLGTDLSIKNLESLHLKDIDWNILPLPGKLCMTEGEERQGCVTCQGFQNLKTLELVKIGTLKKWRGNGTCNLLPHLQNLTVRDCPELIELPISDSTSCQSKHKMSCFPELQTIDILNCPKLLAFPPIPWTSSLGSVRTGGVASGFEQLSYGQSEQRLSIKGKDAANGLFWNLLDFNNLTELQELDIRKCPPISLDHLKMLSCLKTLTIINSSSNVLLRMDGESNAQLELLVENLEIDTCDASGKELTQLLSYFPKLSKLTILKCQNITRLGVVEQQAMTTPALANKAVMQQQTEGADEGLLLLPPKIQELIIWSCHKLSLYCSNSPDNGGDSNNEVECFSNEQEEALKNLTSIQELQILCCGKLQSLPAAGLSQLPSLQTIVIDSCPAICSLGNLPSSLQELIIRDCPSIRSLPKDSLPSTLREIDVLKGNNEELRRQCCKLKGTIPIVYA